VSPNILFVGGDKGAWQMRGVQVAQALNARCTQTPTLGDWRWADVIVLVKRAIDTWGETAKQTRCPVIWDALDYWQQPEQNEWTREQCLEDVNRRRVHYRLSSVIAATQAMAKDIGGVYIPHHHRIGLAPTPPRERVQVVAYEGASKYLGAWRPALEQACAERGARFVVNPPSLTDADVVVAFRDGKWDGWACRQWKSGVKYVNALVAGRPVLTQSCAALAEVVPVARMVDEPSQLVCELDILIASGAIPMAYSMGMMRHREFSIQSIARRYRELVSSVMQVAA